MAPQRIKGDLLPLNKEGIFFKSVNAAKGITTGSRGAGPNIAGGRLLGKKRIARFKRGESKEKGSLLLFRDKKALLGEREAIRLFSPNRRGGLP